MQSWNVSKHVRPGHGDSAASIPFEDRSCVSSWCCIALHGILVSVSKCGLFYCAPLFDVHMPYER